VIDAVGANRGSEGGAVDGARVSFEAYEQLASRHLPQPRGVVPGRGDDARPVRAEGGAQDPARVAFEGGERLARRRLPQPRSLVLRGGFTSIAYNSCRNRHCPKCQGAQAAQWTAAREADLLPVPYFHIVFTLPAKIADIAFTKKAAIYDLLFEASLSPAAF
jgi:hypothetical protein